jgi:hypothetical protein
MSSSLPFPFHCSGKVSVWRAKYPYAAQHVSDWEKGGRQTQRYGEVDRDTETQRHRDTERQSREEVETQAEAERQRDTVGGELREWLARPLRFVSPVLMPTTPQGR